MKFGTRGQLTDEITCQIFSQSVQGLQSSDTPNYHFPLTCCVALTTVYTLPCDTDKLQLEV